MADEPTVAGSGQTVGTVAELWRFPVKSFQGERVDRVHFGSQAMDGDRRWAVRDSSNGKLWSAKRYGALLEGRARTVDGRVEITLPTGASFTLPDIDRASPAALGGGLAEVDAALQVWLGADVHLERVTSDGPSGRVYEFAFDIDDDPDAQWFDIDTPAGSFADLAQAHLLTTASIGAASSGHPDGDWDQRRFRPSILIDTGDRSGFVEDEWMGKEVRLGELVVHVDLPTIRCVMPTRPQPEVDGAGALVRDKAISRAIADEHGHNLGAYTTIVTPGDVAVGDDVVVLA